MDIFQLSEKYTHFCKTISFHCNKLQVKLTVLLEKNILLYLSFCLPLA